MLYSKHKMPRAILKQIHPFRVSIAHSRAARNIYEFRERVLHNFDITSPEWLVLGYVSSQKRQGARVGDIAETLDVQSTYVTGILRKLESKKLVRARIAARDRRARIITTTKKGTTMVDSIEAALIKQADAWLAKASPAAIQHYFSVLEILAEEHQPNQSK